MDERVKWMLDNFDDYDVNVDTYVTILRKFNLDSFTYANELMDAYLNAVRTNKIKKRNENITKILGYEERDI